MAHKEARQKTLPQTAPAPPASETIAVHTGGR